MSGLSRVRQEIAESARAGEVTYAPARAEWQIKGEQARGWVGRTLREMRSEGQLVVSVPAQSDSATLVTVAVSDEVAAELDASEAPTG